MTNLTFEEIYTQYHQKVLVYVKARVNSMTDAEDITSDVFVKVMSALDTYNNEKSQLSTWIYTIATNTIRDFFRKTAVRDKFRCDNSEIFLENVVSDDCDYDEKLFKDASLELLAEALEHLSEQERSIIVLHYYNELTHKKIAEKLSLSYANVRYINHQALKKIRNYFKAKDFMY
jgi:RNA polymerase sigma-70 factor (ECF subfamily)